MAGDFPTTAAQLRRISTHSHILSLPNRRISAPLWSRLHLPTPTNSPD